MKSTSIKLLVILSALLLSSCTPNVPSDSSSDGSSDTSSDTSGDTVSDTSSITDSSTNTSATSTSDSSSDNSTSEPNPNPEAKTISEIRALSLALASSADADGIATSTVAVEFTGKLLARLDAITTQRNYGNRYKLLFVDNTGYIYVKVDLTTYQKMENAIGNSYTIVGNPSIYVGQAEVVITSYKVATAVNVNLASISEEMDNLDAVHDYAATLRLNSKGVAFGKLARIEATYIGKADNSVLLFRDDANAIYLHGDNYVGNRFTLNNSYRLTVAITMFSFRPGIEFIAQESISPLEIDTSISDLPTITATNLYSQKYEVDKNATYPNYSNKFISLLRFEGYANYYLKDGSIYIVLEDTFKTTTYSTYQNAATAKAIFVKNDDSVGLYGDYEYSRCPFSEYISDTPIKIEVAFMPYLWNTSKYWQGYFLTDTINIVE